MNEIICEWCKKTFSNHYNLLYHQKNTSYCLKIQGKLDCKKSFRCDWCLKIYKTKITLSKHQKLRCKKRRIIEYQDEIRDKDIEIRSLKKENKNYISELKDKTIKIESLEKENKDSILEFGDKLKNNDKLIGKYKLLVKSQKEKIKEFKRIVFELEKKVSNKEGVVEGIQIAPAKINNTNTNTTTTTNYIHPKLVNISTTKIKPFTVETIKEHVQLGNYTENLFRKGIRGITEFIKGIILLKLDDGTVEQSYACTDSSRNKFHRFLDSREWKEDNGAHYLNTVFDSIEEPVERYFKHYVNERRYAKGEGDRSYFDEIVKDTEDIYQGVKFKQGEYRNKLHKHVRNDIRTEISV